ncbi:hypothetical protein X962_5660 [Burkholderia pseudomallei MSHR7343]|nr:hypothetical protein X962_5660 [Burkholderia pseudomallei MSHR7343]KGS79768.1 hypothetical protein X947_4315 [Burkholderia pseudomallei MSHR7334]
MRRRAARISREPGRIRNIANHRRIALARHRAASAIRSVCGAPRRRAGPPKRRRAPRPSARRHRRRKRDPRLLLRASGDEVLFRPPRIGLQRQATVRVRVPRR